MTREELERLAIEASCNMKSIRHIKCPNEARNPGIYFGFMIAVEILWPLIKEKECQTKQDTKTAT